MGLGTWTTVEGNVYPSTTRYSGGFQWMVVDEDRVSSNQSKLRLRPYIKKLTSVSNDYAAHNLADQNSYFTIDGADKKIIKTAFDFREASVGVEYPLSSDYPFRTSASVPYVEYTITHDTNGFATVKVGGYIKGEASSSHFQYVSTTASVTFPRINRASTLSMANSPIGKDAIIYISKTDTNYTNKITYDFHGIRGTVAENTSDTQVVWNVPTSFYMGIPAAKSGAGYLYCETFSDGVSIGTSTFIFTVYVDELPSFTPSIASSETDPSILVKNVSTVTAKFLNVVNTPSADGEPVYSILADNAKSNESEATFRKATGDSYTFVYTDPRGISLSQTAKFDAVIDYAPPAVGSVNAQWDYENGEMNVSFSGRWFGGDFAGRYNRLLTVYVVVTPKNSVESVTQTVSFTGSPGLYSSYPFEGSVTFSELDLSTTYNVEIIAADGIYRKDNTEFPARVYTLPAMRATPIFMWNGETFRINGNLEVTGTYPGSGGGTGGGYTAGTGIDISADGVISVETTDDAVQNDDRPVSSGALYTMLAKIDEALGAI